MSMEICPNCKIPLENGVCSTCGFKNVGTKIKVEVGRSAELEALRKEKEDVEKELSEKKSIIEQQAISEFEQLRENLALQFNDDAIKDCGSPNEMFSYIASLNKKQKPIEKRPPTGKSTFLPPSSGGAKDTTALLDAIYDKIQHPELYEKTEVLEAEKQRNALLISLIESPSFADMREHGTKSIEKHTIMPCPKCGYTLVDTEKCDNCKEDWSKTATRNRKSARVWTYQHGKGKEVIPKW